MVEHVYFICVFNTTIMPHGSNAEIRKNSKIFNFRRNKINYWKFNFLYRLHLTTVPLFLYLHHRFRIPFTEGPHQSYVETWCLRDLRYEHQHIG